MFEENYGDTMIQNILDLEQIIDDKSKLITIVFRESFRLLGLFRDKHYEEYKFPTFFSRHPRPSFECSCQKIIQVKLTIVNRKITYHVTNIF
jgi:hypothetical protein